MRTTSQTLAHWFGVARLDPRRAAYVMALVMALSFGYDLVRMPVQVSDSLGEILAARQSPSAYATFVDSLHSTAYMRPLRLAQIKALFDLADGRYRLVYRGFHALLLALAIFLFVRLLDVRTWTDGMAAGFALTVFTGLHTFRGTVREAFPINHFLEVVVLCLLVVNLARSRGGWLVDLAAAVSFVVASLTLESGLLVWVAVVSSWACGMRGISRRGVLAVTALLALYVWARFWLLSTGTPALGERSSGFLLEYLGPEEIRERFGPDPTWFYAYNVAASALTVLFSEPQNGVFELVRSWRAGDVPPRVWVAVVSSVLTTVLIVVSAAARLGARREATRAGDGRLLAIAGAMLVSNATLSYAYTKDEIVSVAGAFYALAACVAVRWAADFARRSPGRGMRVTVCVMLLAIATLWTVRSAGTHHVLRSQAFKHRNDWARVVEAGYLDSDSTEDRDASAAIIQQLRLDAIDTPTPNPALLPRWSGRWWGEE